MHMKPLLILLGTFATALFASFFFSGKADLIFAGRLAMTVMLVFTAIAHFAFREGMAEMIPPPVPFKNELVLLTGVFEILGGIGLLVPGLARLTAVLLILFFIFVLPANISAAKRNIDYQSGKPNGSGPGYLWFRVPLQIVFIGWTWFFCFGSL